jgi:hypothetical protein
MQDKKVTRAKKVIDALRGHYGEKVGEFAERLGVAPSTVSTWSNRDVLDEDLIFRKCKGVSFSFLQTGDGPMFIDDGQGLPSSNAAELPDPMRKAIDVLQKNPGQAWELYALILEKAEKK